MTWQRLLAFAAGAAVIIGGALLAPVSIPASAALIGAGSTWLGLLLPQPRFMGYTNGNGKTKAAGKPQVEGQTVPGGGPEGGDGGPPASGR